MPAMSWADLKAENGILDALDHAGPRPEDGDQNVKRDWSQRFANGCAVAIAAKFRAHKALKRKTVKPPSLSSGTEPVTPLGAGEKKRIDVTVVDTVLGLELGASLKGLNFVDNASRNYDKNLTGRLYELGDELRLVHERLPHAFMAGIFFLPLGSCSDKGGKTAPSSFANAVVKLRARTGRLDSALPAHASRCDASYVALYIHTTDASFERGAVRFFNVNGNPPRRGRPKTESTLSLAEMVDQIVAVATHRTEAIWVESEEDMLKEVIPDGESPLDLPDEDDEQ